MIPFPRTIRSGDTPSSSQAEHSAGATKASSHFVNDEKDTVPVTKLTYGAQVPRRRGDDTSGCLYSCLDHDCGNLVTLLLQNAPPRPRPQARPHSGYVRGQRAAVAVGRRRSMSREQQGTVDSVEAIDSLLRLPHPTYRHGTRSLSEQTGFVLGSHCAASTETPF